MLITKQQAGSQRDSTGVQVHALNVPDSDSIPGTA